ncbi:Fasciclin-domain-containing protein [Stereum hirsutum FP-91666 SS1]|uniref:Fasciclin-domain-containing protein n=1 Tax=Stereum hirsutum (strain FP-91666) TaxID=721885 RepID=UPI000440AC13|nr:Fasciclin-domain-containing protein [Stereum hirsutum FP-91666 SS1]EIM91840.1 Fasciclin-domain-containing protein [Stereum hirsutum FP-91666 SS1]
MAQNSSYFLGLAQALNDQGLSTLATLAAGALNDTAGPAFFEELQSGNKTLFAPSNEALSSLSSATSNTTALLEILSYHILDGNFTDLVSTYPNVTLGRTLLNDTNLVALEGNESQVVAFSKVGGSVVVLNQNYTTVQNSSSYSNLLIWAINATLTPPGSLNETVGVNSDLSALASLASTLELPESGSDSNISALEYLAAQHGFTLFAPSNSALANVSAALQTVQSNQTALGDLVRNHIVVGETLYSPLLLSSTSSNYTSSAGESLSITTNSSGTYVVSGGISSAKISQSDVLVENGVIHVIDGVLLNLEVNEAAASSAIASASSVASAAATASATGPVGGATQANPAPSASSSSSSSSSDAVKNAVGVGMLGWAVMLGGAVIGGMSVWL